MGYIKFRDIWQFVFYFLESRGTHKLIQPRIIMGLKVKKKVFFTKFCKKITAVYLVLVPGHVQINIIARNVHIGEKKGI